MSENADAAEIVIVKVRRHDPELEGSHNGVWKLAYADFVTAMMAFFLLMWLVNVTTKEQRDGISNYFNPISVATGMSGTDGLLAGRTTDTEGVLDAPDGPGRIGHPVSAPPVISALGSEKRVPQGAQDERGSKARDEAKDTAVSPLAMNDVADTQSPETPGVRTFDDPFAEPAEAVRAEASRSASAAEALDGVTMARGGKGEDLEEVKDELLQQLTALMAKKGLADNVKLSVDKEGLRIQISDDNKFSMFPVGSTRFAPEALDILGAISTVIRDIPNGIMITGHTDARPYHGSEGYSNWELSSDRANAARRALIGGGLDPDRILRVEGHGDRVPLVKADPLDPRNRRISILVLAKP